MLFQFVVTLIITSYFLFNQGSYVMIEKVLFAVLIIVCVVNCGGMLEKRPWAIPSEALKFALIMGTSYYFFGLQVLTISLIAYCLLSIILLVFLRTEINENRLLNVPG